LVSNLSDAFHSTGVFEEEQRQQVGLATRFTLRDEKPQELRQDQGARGATPGSWAEFWTGFPWTVESVAFTQGVADMNDDYFGYESDVSGGGGSPRIWGRGAGFLGRSGQSLLKVIET
jgi:hypothetical protein